VIEHPGIDEPPVEQLKESLPERVQETIEALLADVELSPTTDDSDEDDIDAASELIGTVDDFCDQLSKTVSAMPECADVRREQYNEHLSMQSYFGMVDDRNGRALSVGRADNFHFECFHANGTIDGSFGEGALAVDVQDGDVATIRAQLRKMAYRMAAFAMGSTLNYGAAETTPPASS